MHHPCQTKSFILNELEIIIKEHEFPEMFWRRQSCQKLCSIPTLQPVVQTILCAECWNYAPTVRACYYLRCFFAVMFPCTQCHNTCLCLLDRGGAQNHKILLYICIYHFITYSEIGIGGCRQNKIFESQYLLRIHVRDTSLELLYYIIHLFTRISLLNLFLLFVIT